MSDRDRICVLEARVAYLEQRVAELLALAMLSIDPNRGPTDRRFVAPKLHPDDGRK